MKTQTVKVVAEARLGIEDLLTTDLEPDYEYLWLYTDGTRVFTSYCHYDSEEAFHRDESNKGFQLLGAIKTTKRKKAVPITVYQVQYGNISSYKVRNLDSAYGKFYKTFRGAKRALVQYLKRELERQRTVVKDYEELVRKAEGLTEDEVKSWNR